MSRRLKVLISAYACAPGKGSEPELGWQWAMQMARYHDVLVLTRASNREAIESELAMLPRNEPVPAFVYYDRDPFLVAIQAQLRIIKLYYLLWQRSAHDVIKRLNQAHRFDVMHHVTFGAFRYPTAVWGHGVPVVWGPVGGISSLPLRLLPWRHLPSLIHELMRSGSNLVQSAPFFSLPERARASAVVLASTQEMQSVFARLGIKSEFISAIGLNTGEVRCAPAQKRPGAMKLLFAGKVITLKGIDLAIDALAKSGTTATLTVIGDGSYLNAARRQARKLGLADRVHFAGRLPREELLSRYRDFDVLLFPSLHDTGGYVVIEAMLNELPVICLDFGGPGIAVSAETGIKVPLSNRGGMVDELARAISVYDTDREKMREDGKRARKRIVEEYDWNKKGLRMSEQYERAVGTITEAERESLPPREPGFGRSLKLAHLLFSLRGVGLSFIGLLLVATLFFFSLSRLKSQAKNIVEDNLPGLSYAGEAESTLSAAFHRTLLVMLAQSAEQRAELEREIASLSDQTTTVLAAYKEQIFSPADEAIYNRVLARRAQYLRVRIETFKLLDQNQMAAASANCQTNLLPAFNAYKIEADKLLEFNMHAGRTNGESIMRICAWTQVMVAAIGVLIFIAGFFIGISR